MCARVEVRMAPHASVEKRHSIAHRRGMVRVAGPAVIASFLRVAGNRERKPVEQHLGGRRAGRRNGIE